MTALLRETIETLEQLQSSYKLSHTTPPRCNVGEEVKCVIYDKATGKPYATAVAGSEPAAIVLAVEVATDAQKPQTPAQMSVELKQLREQVAEQTAENERLRAGASPTSDEDAEPTQEPPTPARPTAATHGPANNSADLVAQLDARNLTLPEGDRRTSAWRQAALELLELDREVSGAA